MYLMNGLFSSCFESFQAHSVVSLKEFIDMAFIRKPKFFCDFVNTLIAKPNPVLNKPDAIGRNIMLDAFTALIAKITAKISGGYTKFLSD